MASENVSSKSTKNALTGERTSGAVRQVDVGRRPAVGARLAWLTTGTATAAALLLWTLVVPVGGMDLRAGGAGTGSGGDGPTVGPVNVAFVAVVAGLAAWAVASRMRRRGAPRRGWLWLCGGLLIASLAGPVSASTLASGVTLVGMHVVVGGVLALGYARAWRS